LSYQGRIENGEGKKRVHGRLMLNSSGNLRLESPRSDLEILAGSLWAKDLAEKMSVYDIGVAGEELLVIEWREERGGAVPGPGKPAEDSKEFYGIGLTHAQNLTIINSD